MTTIDEPGVAPRPNLSPYRPQGSTTLPKITPRPNVGAHWATPQYATLFGSPRPQPSLFGAPPPPVNYANLFGRSPAPVTMATILGQRQAPVPPIPAYLQPPAQAPTPTPTKEQLEMRSSMYYEGRRLADYAAYSYAIATRQNAWSAYLTNLAIESELTGGGGEPSQPQFGGGGGGGGRRGGGFALGLFNWRV